MISTHTPHAGRNDKTADKDCKDVIFQLTRPMRGATHMIFAIYTDIMISTHTPHAGRNIYNKPNVEIRFINFNSHAPCGAQHNSLTTLSGDLTISTHTPHAGRNIDLFANMDTVKILFQLTRPMRGATKSFFYLAYRQSQFQLTRPMRGATVIQRRCTITIFISTHTPHAGRNQLFHNL